VERPHPFAEALRWVFAPVVAWWTFAAVAPWLIYGGCGMLAFMVIATCLHWINQRGE